MSTFENTLPNAKILYIRAQQQLKSLHVFARCHRSVAAGARAQ